MPGRKQVVYFSEGFDSSLLTGAAGPPPTGPPAIGADAATQTQQALQRDRANQDVYLANSDESFGSTQTVNALEKMLEEFRRADCVIQAVDIGGLRAGGDQRRARAAGGKDSLLTMARGTGGELFQNSNDLAGAIGGIARAHQPHLRPLLPAGEGQAGRRLPQAEGGAEGRAAGHPRRLPRRLLRAPRPTRSSTRWRSCSRPPRG